MNDYVNKKLAELSDKIEKAVNTNESADFYKGFLTSLNDDIKWLHELTYIKMKGFYIRTAEIEALVNSYNYNTKYIDSYSQRLEAEKHNSEIEQKLIELNVLEFRNIKL